MFLTRPTNSGNMWCRPTQTQGHGDNCPQIIIRNKASSDLHTAAGFYTSCLLQSTADPPEAPKSGLCMCQSDSGRGSWRRVGSTQHRYISNTSVWGATQTCWRTWLQTKDVRMLTRCTSVGVYPWSNGDNRSWRGQDIILPRDTVQALLGDPNVVSV